MDSPSGGDDAEFGLVQTYGILGSHQHSVLTTEGQQAATSRTVTLEHSTS